MSDLLARLIAAGTPAELVGEVAMLIAEARLLEERRARDASRKAEKRATNRTDASEDVRGHVGQARMSASREGARAEPKITNSSSTHSKNKGEGADALLAPLKAVLNEETAKAVVAHRRAMKKPLTERASKKLAERLGAFPDPNAAADEMMLRGWTSIDATWESLRPSTGPPGRAPPPAAKTELPKWEGPFDGYRTAAERDKARNGEVLRRGHGVHRDDEEGDGEGSLFGDQTGHG